MSPLLIGAGLYNLLWALIAIVIPNRMLGWLGVETTAVSVHFWQCIGMIVGVYGIGYLIAARGPYRHWPVTLVGLLGKIFGPIGFAFGVAGGTLPASLGWTIVTNDLVWLIPFAMILWGAVRYHQAMSSAYDMPEADDPIRELSTNDGRRLDDLADQQPQLVVFLRDTGCMFCREALADISAQRTQIEAAGCGIVLVYPGEDDPNHVFSGYNMHDVPRISDPSLRLYRQFGLELGAFAELLGLRVLVRGLFAGLLHGHGIIRRNTFQMPGVYLYHCRHILGGFRHDRASDRPDYFALAQQVQATPDSVVV